MPKTDKQNAEELALIDLGLKTVTRSLGIVLLILLSPLLVPVFILVAVIQRIMLLIGRSVRYCENHGWKW